MTAKKKTWNDVEILVVGAGTMGSSIAQAYAQNGFTVGLLDVSDEILERAKGVIAAELDRARGRIFSDEEIDAIQSRILTTSSYKKACSGKKLKIAIESATERIDIKLKIFEQLDNLCAKDVVLATNSSSLDTNILSKAIKRKDKVVWMHYFYLPHKNRAGEVAGTDTASQKSVDIANYYMKMGGKVVTPILNSRKGGAADIIFVALLLEACRMVDEGFKMADIEAAGGTAFGMPLGFLGLMDVTGLAVGLFAMDSFSDDSNKKDPLLKVYGDFFKPPQIYRALVAKQAKAKDPSKVTWIPAAGLGKGKGVKVVNELMERFLAVGFASAFEIVNAGVIKPEEFEKLTRNAFLWRKGPFTIFNDWGVKKAWKMVQDRAKLAKKLGHDFPIPKNLEKLAKSGKSQFPMDESPVQYRFVPEISAAWITLSAPESANALDDNVFARLEKAFAKANKDPKVKSIVFDTAPIKTFIAGANVPQFVEALENNEYAKICKATEKWQDVMFHKMTGSGKPKVAIVDGIAFGGGVETAMAFAWDPDTIVIATNRTSFTLPEVRLGIYPGLRGTLMMPRIIHRKTGDDELAVAMSRYYILAGGTPTSSPRFLKYLGFADLLVQSNEREVAARAICKEISKNRGKPLDAKKLKALKIKELPSKLTEDEEEEIRVMKNLFLTQDLIPTLYAFGRRQAEIFHTSPWREQVQRISNRMASASPNATWVSNWLISKGFEDYMNGVPLEESAKYELENHLEATFRHPDALCGLKALINREFPVFPRRYPFGE